MMNSKGVASCRAKSDELLQAGRVPCRPKRERIDQPDQHDRRRRHQSRPRSAEALPPPSATAGRDRRDADIGQNGEIAEKSPQRRGPMPSLSTISQSCSASAAQADRRGNPRDKPRRTASNRSPGILPVRHSHPPRQFCPGSVARQRGQASGRVRRFQGSLESCFGHRRQFGRRGSRRLISVVSISLRRRSCSPSASMSSPALRAWANSPSMRFSSSSTWCSICSCSTFTLAS